jgi:hypothetical protein
LYDSDIKAILSSGYNFKYLKAIDVKMPFVDLLKLITEDKNLVITLVLNALTCILSEQSEEKDSSYVGIVSEEDATRLDSIKRRVSSINYKQLSI